MSETQLSLQIASLREPVGSLGQASLFQSASVLATSRADGWVRRPRAVAVRPRAAPLALCVRVSQLQQVDALAAQVQ